MTGAYGVRAGLVAARVQGEGDPVLLLHGIGGSSASFDAITPLLVAHGHRTIAWDAPGYGVSEDPPQGFGIDSYVEQVAGLLTALSAVPAHVVGVSWGGVIATWLAARRPSLVRSLVLADSTRGSGVTAERAAAMRQRVRDLADLGAPEFARQRARNLVSPQADDAVVAGVTQQMSRVRLPGYREAAEMMAASDTSGVLGRLGVPVLVLVGEHDRVTGVAESERLAESIPGARLVVIPEAGHAAIQERPTEIAGLLAEFQRYVQNERA